MKEEVNEPVLFIGGPWDGKRMMLKGGKPLWHVAVGAALASGFDTDPLAQQQVYLPSVDVVYERFRMPGDVIMYVVKPSGHYMPSSVEHPYVRIIQQLAEGYRNFARQ